MSMRFKVVKQEVDSNTNFWVAIDTKKDEYLADCLVKTENGLRHINIKTDEEPRKFDVVRMLNHQSNLYQRPFSLENKKDIFSESTTLALYDDFCKTHNIDSKRVFKEAYPMTGNVKTFDSVLLLGKWQGVEYPNEWNQDSYKKLISLLNDSSQFKLVETLNNEVAANSIFMDKNDKSMELDILLKEIERIDLSPKDTNDSAESSDYDDDEREHHHF